jgi:hypothetical protein
MPRLEQARTPAVDARDPLQILAAANEGRIGGLLPEKYRRMRQSTFSFFRGAAPLMAWDLSRLPHCGLTVQLCGDAHVRNLGAYAAPDGRLVFDINDFDETMPGPWEWDVKRLATSLVLAGEESGESEERQRAAVRAFVASYRTHLREFSRMPIAKLARYLIARSQDEPLLDSIFRSARRVTPERNFAKLVVFRNGRFCFHDRSPILEHVPGPVASSVVRGLAGYRETLNASRRRPRDRPSVRGVCIKRRSGHERGRRATMWSCSLAMIRRIRCFSR